MGELTAALTLAATAKDVVRAVAEHVLPPLGADGLVVEILEGGRLHVVGSAGYSGEFLHRSLDGIPLHSNAAVSQALRTRSPAFVESPAQFKLRYPDMASLTDTSDKRAWAFLPLVASDHGIGCCVISFRAERSFSDGERTLLIALSGLVAQALERARLFDVARARARELQRGLLPGTIPVMPAITSAARYLPAARNGEVGGDWYDVIPLSADRVALVVGDVMGHGITEAATMGMIRTAVRTLADLELPPDEILTRLNALVSDLGDDFYATCLYAVFDPVTRTCRFASAGHPPILAVHPDGSVHRLGHGINPPLGAAEPPFDTDEVVLPEECLLVLYTDGLIEYAQNDADHGLRELTRVLTAGATPWDFSVSDHCSGRKRLEDLCETVVSALLPDQEQTTDDAALLIAHVRGTPPDHVASWALADGPRAAGEARALVRERLAVWGLEELEPATELVVSELVGNAVRHAQGPIRLRLIRSRALVCEVYDGSLTTPHIRRAAAMDEGGRGLQLVAAVSHRWGARYGDDGKCIWAEQPIPPDISGP